MVTGMRVSVKVLSVLLALAYLISSFMGSTFDKPLSGLLRISLRLALVKC